MASQNFIYSAFATTLTFSLICSPAAKADDIDFVHAAQAMGFIQRADNLISTAQSACYFLTLNRDPQEVEARILRYTRIDPPSRAHQFFVLAANTYCPQYVWLVGS